jgi:hypothetical protein
MGSANLTGSPSGTRITLVAHPLMSVDAIAKALTEAGTLLSIFTRLVLSKKRLNEL